MQPEQKRQKLEYVERPPLKHRAVQTNDPQRAKWSDLKGNNDQSFKDPYGGVEHGRDVNAPEKDDSQKVSQIDVSENIGEERHRHKNKADFGSRSHCLQKAPFGFSSWGP